MTGTRTLSFARGKVKLRFPYRCKTTRLQNALYQWDSSVFLSVLEIAKALFKKVQEMLCLCLRDEIIDEEGFFCFTKHTGRVIFLFLTRRMNSSPSLFAVVARDLPASLARRRCLSISFVHVKEIERKKNQNPFISTI